jgi:large subunit ribosomal protein L11
MSRVVRLIVAAAKAKPSPQIGQAMGGLGLNMMQFLKDFNAKSAGFQDDIPCRVFLYVTPGSQNYSFDVFLPRTSWFLKKAAGQESGASRPGEEIAGVVHVKQLYEIADLKLKEGRMNSTVTHEAFVKSLVAQCHSMGFAVTAKENVPEAASS